MDIVFASSNSGKCREFNLYFRELRFNLISQQALGVVDAEETGKTFIENAIIKARHAAAETLLPAIADDSGLIVAALHGEPGIYSARYAGEHGNAAKNIAKLLKNLNNTQDSQRLAYFYCVIVYLREANDPMPIIGEGKWTGRILTSPRGDNGFGYDPVFYDPKEDKSAAELALARKNEISHRALALRDLVSKLHKHVKNYG